MSIEQKCAKRKNFNSNLCSMRKMFEQKVCCQEFWLILSGLDIKLEQPCNDNLAGKNWFKAAKDDRLLNLFSVD